MARLPRFSFTGQLHLVVLEAVDSQVLFVDDEDRRRFMLALLECTRACEVDLHAYAMLDAQVLLLVTPREAESLGRFMQRLGRRYVGAFNLRHRRSGALWARRYRAAAVEAATHGLRCVKLIEQAPIRAGLVAHARDWPWSSASHHVGRERQSVLKEHELHWQLGNTPFEREARHLAALDDMLPPSEVDALLTASQRGWPIGSADYIAELEAAAGRQLRPAPRGRPRGPARTVP